MDELKKIVKKKRVAWGITGSGDKLLDVLEVMKNIKEQYFDEVRVTAYLSKAGELVIKYYRKLNELEKEFEKIRVEINSNIPTLAVQLQSGKIEFLLIAPATSNTVAKIANGIADTLLTNAAIMALKTYVPVYILPCDFKEGDTITQLPDGSNMKIHVRKEDAEYVEKLKAMEGILVLEKPREIIDVFEKYFSIKF
ncbi:archaeoflavoprotein AfpA [Candidatus Bathyarchaeota archaeon]|nr:archaeoflavoprotein AfpA [Candidatus Bathyarchaeota archaeon]